ncbi:MAG: hypothetical protein R3230_01505 [Nitrosopumilaceae archaeon]|nr:hypothetical protein [Nitrosopumilaceae archaeon]
MSQIVIYDTSSIMGDVSQLTTDNGVVLPTVGGNINIVGSQGIYTDGSVANTVTLEFETFELQTTDDTESTLFTTADLEGAPFIANTSILVQLLVTGTRDDYSDMVGGTLSVIARNAGAGAVIVQEFDQLMEGTTEIDWDTSGADVRLRVTGNIGETWNWKVQARYLIQNS